MEIVKKNILSIVCGVVALLAVAASFWPLGGQQEALQSQLAGRVSLYQSLEALKTKQRHAPVVNVESTEQEPLTRFPNDDLIKQGEAIKTQFQGESKKILDQAVALNKHEELVKGSLPAPRPAQAFQFRDQYKIAMDQTIPHDILKIGTPPTVETIKAATDKLWTDKYASQIMSVGNTGNKAMIEEEFKKEAEKVPEQERKRVAMESMCYMEPTALTVDTTLITSAKAADPVQIWFAQLGLWIQMDVAKSIAAANAGSKNVTESPVKHLIKIAVRPSPYVLPPNAPGPIEGDASAAVPKVIEVSATGRVTNPLYDVVDFDVTVNVEADKIIWFLKELGNQKFITVLTVQVGSVDSASQQALGYFYGPKPVAQLTLHCEGIFFRQWSRPLMPPLVIQNMAGPGGAMPGGGGYPGAGGGRGSDLPGGREMY